MIAVRKSIEGTSASLHMCIWRPRVMLRLVPAESAPGMTTVGGKRIRISSADVSTNNQQNI
jgi:hypothetical protein